MDEAGNVAQRGTLATTDAGLRRGASGMQATRFVMEAGTHSPWVRRVLMRLGHEVLVANPNRLKLITQSADKNDRVDAEWLVNDPHRFKRADRWAPTSA